MEHTYATKHIKKIPFCSNCLNGRYVGIRFDDIPAIIRNLSEKDQEILSIFNIDTGKYTHRKSGYRIRTGSLS